MLIANIFSREVVAGNTVEDIAVFVGIVVATIIVGKAVQALFRGRLRKLAEKSKTKLDDVVLETFEKPLYWILFMLGFSIAFRTLELPDNGSEIVTVITTLFITVFGAWSASNFLTAVRKVYVDPIIEDSETKLDDQVVPILERTLKVTIWTLAILVVLSNLDVDIVSLLTGLGIGGLALAMAAQDTLANIFGSFTIFADRPFQVDDVVEIAGHTGTLTDVGLRTCRMRTFDGTLVTVPNRVLVGGVVENLSAREARKFSGTIGLVYETTSEQLEAAIEALGDILMDHELVRDDYSVRLMNFGDSALELSVIYWVNPPSEYFGVVHEVNMAIKKACDANGWDMAFPSMTLYKAA